MFRFLIPAILLISFISPFKLKSQDTILYINGKKKDKIEVMKVDSEYIYFLKEKKRTVNSAGRLKAKKREVKDIYAIINEKGITDTIYKPDSAKGYSLSRVEMYDYIKGCQAAYRDAKSPLIGPIGFFLSGAAVFILDGYWAIPIPFIYSASMAFITPVIPDDVKVAPGINKYYIMGYQDTKKNKRIRSGALFGVAGYISANIIYYVIIQ